jgi:hypothetical protein
METFGELKGGIMMKAFYALSWVLLGLTAVTMALNGTLGPVALVGLSLAAAALVYGLALWSVITNTQDPKLQVFDRNL